MSMEQIAVFGVILLFWGMGALAERMEKNERRMRSMSDEELIAQMNYSGHFDNEYRREYARRHPHGAMANMTKIKE